jgi:photosystem II stability/assembly factor-like uncharacterized protein
MTGTPGRIRRPTLPWQYTRVAQERADQTGTLFLTNGDAAGIDRPHSRSRDGGRSWEDAGITGSTARRWCVATNLGRPNFIVAVGNFGQIHRSTDGGDVDEAERAGRDPVRHLAARLSWAPLMSSKAQ